MAPFPYQPQGTHSLKGNHQGESLLLKDIWWVMISWVLVPEFQESKVHRGLRKVRNNHFPECAMASPAHLVLGLAFQKPDREEVIYF